MEGGFWIGFWIGFWWGERVEEVCNGKGCRVRGRVGERAQPASGRAGGRERAAEAARVRRWYAPVLLYRPRALLLVLVAVHAHGVDARRQQVLVDRVGVALVLRKNNGRRRRLLQRLQHRLQLVLLLNVLHLLFVVVVWVVCRTLYGGGCVCVRV
jgi:hypothetical protein